MSFEHSEPQPLAFEQQRPCHRPYSFYRDDELHLAHKVFEIFYQM
jgi:hypothetical protein